MSGREKTVKTPGVARKYILKDYGMSGQEKTVKAPGVARKNKKMFKPKQKGFLMCKFGGKVDMCF